MKWEECTNSDIWVSAAKLCMAGAYWAINTDTMELSLYIDIGDLFNAGSDPERLLPEDVEAFKNIIENNEELNEDEYYKSVGLFFARKRGLSEDFNDWHYYKKK